MGALWFLIVVLFVGTILYIVLNIVGMIGAGITENIPWFIVIPVDIWLIYMLLKIVL